DSTVMRSSGVPFAHSILAYQNIITGLSKLTLNEEQSQKELNDHWEILAEALQIILRKEGQTGAYELIKEATRGKIFDQHAYQALLNQLPLTPKSYQKLSSLTPATYLGLSSRLV
ncbi:MAG: adenylosuccinate lyase, partial [Candidatus Magasanikbacteria bacterium]|nr:adenylosuccinate lyase [Candidatus Magasanikbacteria bacterium]